MKNLTLIICFLLLIIGCTTKKKAAEPKVISPPNSETNKFEEIEEIDIEFLMADTLLGVRLFEGDIGSTEIILDSVSIEVQDYDHSIEQDKLTFTNLATPRLVIEETVGEFQGKAPYPVSKLHFKEVILMQDGKEIGRIKNVDVNRFKVETWGVTSTFNPRNVHEEGLYLKLSDIETRLNKLIKLVKVTTQKQPDHSARTLPPELEEIRTRIVEIKEFHARNVSGISTIRVHLKELDEIELTFDEMEEEILDPENTPNTIENTVFFEPGEYEIKESVNLSVFQNDITKVIERINELHISRPDRQIVIKLSVTGYADDLEVKTGELENSLCDSTTVSPCPPNINEQEFLNQVLSEQRAKNVFRYMKSELVSRIPLEIVNYEFEEKDFIGKGQKEEPRSMSKPCSGDCSERRVTVVSSLIYSQKE